jgi:hypothetical protein
MHTYLLGCSSHSQTIVVKAKYCTHSHLKGWQAASWLRSCSGPTLESGLVLLQAWQPLPSQCRSPGHSWVVHCCVHCQRQHQCQGPH